MPITLGSHNNFLLGFWQIREDAYRKKVGNKIKKKNAKNEDENQLQPEFQLLAVMGPKTISRFKKRNSSKNLKEAKDGKFYSGL